MIDQRLRLASPGQDIPHCRDRAKHRTGGVDGVAAFLKHHRAGGCRQRFAGDRDPVAGVEGRLCRSPRARRGLLSSGLLLRLGRAEWQRTENKDRCENEVGEHTTHMTDRCRTNSDASGGGGARQRQWRRPPFRLILGGSAEAKCPGRTG
jgi:hypothetical protein